MGKSLENYMGKSMYTRHAISLNGFSAPNWFLIFDFEVLKECASTTSTLSDCIVEYVPHDWRWAAMNEQQRGRLASWFSKPCDGMPSNFLEIPRHLKKRGGCCQSIDLATPGRTSASTTTKALRGLQPTYFGNCGWLSESSNNCIFKGELRAN